MSYAFWSLVGQGVQIGVASQQLNVARQQASQLLAINNQLAYQQAVQQQQAILNQVLFETEQAAASLSAMSSHDPFSAGVLSCLRLRYVNGIDPSSFHALDAKRSWAQATGFLASRWQWVESNPSVSEIGRRFVQAMEQLMHWRKVLGPEPEAELGRRESALADAEQSFKYCLMAMAAGPVLFVIGAAGSFPFIGFVGVALPIIAAVKASKIYGIKKKMRKDAEEYRGNFEQFNAFMASPEGGGLLNGVAAQHPQLAA